MTSSDISKPDKEQVAIVIAAHPFGILISIDNAEELIHLPEVSSVAPYCIPLHFRPGKILKVRPTTGSDPKSKWTLRAVGSPNEISESLSIGQRIEATVIGATDAFVSLEVSNQIIDMAIKEFAGGAAPQPSQKVVLIVKDINAFKQVYFGIADQ